MFYLISHFKKIFREQGMRLTYFRSKINSINFEKLKLFIICIIVTIKTNTVEISVKIRFHFIYHTPKSVILELFHSEQQKQQQWFCRLCCKALSGDKCVGKSYRMDYLALLRPRQDWQSWNMPAGRRLTKATKFQQQPWLFQNRKMKKSKYHWFRCLIHQTIAIFHADSNGAGLNCDNDAQNEKS